MAVTQKEIDAERNKIVTIKNRSGIETEVDLYTAKSLVRSNDAEIVEKKKASNPSQTKAKRVNYNSTSTENLLKIVEKRKLALPKTEMSHKELVEFLKEEDLKGNQEDS